jgi:beta-galactosidase
VSYIPRSGLIAAALVAGLFGPNAARCETKFFPRYSTAGFFAIDGSPRQVFDFNPGWRYHKGDLAGAEAVRFDDSAWEVANLPHGLEINPENSSGMRNYQGPAWYRKRFRLPAGMQGKEVVLYFEAAMRKADVWVNGEKVA